MLLRVDPFRELDRFFEAPAARARPGLLAMDAVRSADAVEIRFDLPGVEPDRIELTVENNELTISAERGWQTGDEDTILAAERPQGSVTRQIQLGEGLDADRLEASFDRGVLSLRIPVAEQAKPRKVAISVADGSRTIETTSKDATTG